MTLIYILSNRDNIDVSSLKMTPTPNELSPQIVNNCGSSSSFLHVRNIKAVSDTVLSVLSLGILICNHRDTLKRAMTSNFCILPLTAYTPVMEIIAVVFDVSLIMELDLKHRRFTCYLCPFFASIL